MVFTGRATAEGDVCIGGAVIPSTYIWSAPLPDNLQPGVHAITVDAVDEFGDEHRGYGILEVVEPE